MKSNTHTPNSSTWFRSNKRVFATKSILLLHLIGATVFALILVAKSFSTSLFQANNSHVGEDLSDIRNTDHRQVSIQHRPPTPLQQGDIPYPKDVIRQTHKWTTHGTHPNSTSALLVVTSRETLISCKDSLETYLSPNFHTLYLFEEEIAQGLGIDELVLSVTRKTSAGAHLMTTEGMTGNMHGRTVGAEFASFLEKGGYPVEFVGTVECAVHLLPHEHKKYKSMDAVINQMVDSFRIAREARRHGTSIEDNYNADGNTILSNEQVPLKMPMNRMEILGMNANLWEVVPNMEELEGYHGYDVGDWAARSRRKPQKLVDAGLPWLYDTSQMLENHIMLFDLQALRKIWKLVPSLARFPKVMFSANVLTPIANMYNMTIVRNNEIELHLSFKIKNYDDIDPVVDENWLRGKSVELLGRTLSPRYDYGCEAAIDRSVGMTTDVMLFPWKAALCIKWDAEVWLPRNGIISGIPIADPSMKRILTGVLRYFGYELQDSLSTDGQLLFERDSAFPGTRTIRLSPGDAPSDDDWIRLVTIRTGTGLWTLYLCSCKSPLCTKTERLLLTYPKEHRRFQIPLQNATIESIDIAEGCGLRERKGQNGCCYGKYSLHWKDVKQIVRPNPPAIRREMLNYYHDAGQTVGESPGEVSRTE